MKILILGSGGFLGCSLHRQLTKTKHIIIPLVRQWKNVNDIECDIGNPIKLLEVLNNLDPQVIINCAAKVDFSSSSLVEQYKVNALAPSVVASWCSESKAHLIHVSGSIVNGGTNSYFDNESLELPDNHYGKTKLAADQAIRLSQCSHTIIRFGGIFGEGGPRHLGINNAINRARNGIIPTIVGTGKALRNYIHVEDAAKLLIHCLDHGVMGTHYSGSHHVNSIAQMLNDICSVYLNNATPLYREGLDGADQTIKVEHSFPKTLTFKQALETYQ